METMTAIKQTTTDVGETYRYRGETRRRPKLVTNYWVHCPECGWSENHGLLPAARRARDDHSCP